MYGYCSLDPIREYIGEVLTLDLNNASTVIRAGI